MDELTPFERRLSASLEALVGPRRGVDTATIAQAAVGSAAPATHGNRSVLPTPRRWLLPAAALLALATGGALIAGSRLVERHPIIPLTPAEGPPFALYLGTAEPYQNVPDLWAIRTGETIETGGPPTRIWPGMLSTSDATWSLDGRRLVIGHQGTIHVADVTDHVGRLIDTGYNTGCPSCRDSALALSPDGRTVAFVREPASGPQSRIATLDLWSGQVHELAATDAIGGLRGWSPRWSPDNAQLVYEADGNEDGRTDVMIVNVDGTDARRLEIGDLEAFAPDWSPDGSRIVFSTIDQVAADSYLFDLYLIRPDGTGLTQLRSDGASLSGTWTPDGRIMFEDVADRLWIMDADGRNVTQLTSITFTLSAVGKDLDSPRQVQPTR